MDKTDLTKTIAAAIAETENWSVEGWKTTFGLRNTEVNCLADAQKLPREFVNRLEAIAYWENVALAAGEATKWGKKALFALEKNDLKDAEDSLYYTLVIERPLRSETTTWNASHQKMKAILKGSL